MRIGIIDSGIGGLTVLKAILDKYPYGEYIYYGDTKNLPYGDKSRAELKEYCQKIFKFFEEQKVSTIIVACGTLCSSIYEDLKKMTQINVYNIVDMTTNYVNKKGYKKVLLLATTLSIKTHYFKNQIESRTKVFELACPLLVPLIEGSKYDECTNVISTYISKYSKEKVEAVILGCTHYPLIADKIKSCFKHNIDIIDMGQVFTKYVQIPKCKCSVTIYFSHIDTILINNVKNIIGENAIISLMELR